LSENEQVIQMYLYSYGRKNKDVHCIFNVIYYVTFYIFSSLEINILFYSSFVHKFRLREKPIDESTATEGKGYECLCIGSQNLGTVRKTQHQRILFGFLF
jgi:hypothetical protein